MPGLMTIVVPAAAVGVTSLVIVGNVTWGPKPAGGKVVIPCLGWVAVPPVTE